MNQCAGRCDHSPIWAQHGPSSGACAGACSRPIHANAGARACANGRPLNGACARPIHATAGACTCANGWAVDGACSQPLHAAAGPRTCAYGWPINGARACRPICTCAMDILAQDGSLVIRAVG